MTVFFKKFTHGIDGDGLDEILALARAFASRVGPRSLISIDTLGSSWTVIVWYWGDAEFGPDGLPR